MTVPAHYRIVYRRTPQDPWEEQSIAHSKEEALQKLTDAFLTLLAGPTEGLHLVVNQPGCVEIQTYNRDKGWVRAIVTLP